MIELEGVDCKRGSNLVLQNVNLKFESGIIYGLIGESGAGKTSLLKLIAGLLDADKGVIKFDGNHIMGPSVKLVPGYDDIQLVNQDFGLEPFHSVEENIREKVMSRHTVTQNELIEEYLELVELTKFRNRKAVDLSGGEQQRLAIARALACEPKIILLDEPFVHLDQRLRWKVMNYLNELNKERNMTVVMVSHDGSEVVGFVQQVVVIEKGKVVREDKTFDVYYHPRSLNEAYLLGEMNCVTINEEKILFRPNEYAPSGDIEVSFLRSIDTGVVMYNYFSTKNKEEILLYSNNSISDIKGISIVKK